MALATQPKIQHCLAVIVTLPTEGIMVALTGLTAHHAFEITSFLLYPELGNLSPHPMGIVLYREVKNGWYVVG